MRTSKIFFPFFCVAVLFAACGAAEEQTNRRAAAAHSPGANGAVSPDGMAVFRQYCVTCHGADGKLGLNGAKDLSTTVLTLEERINIIADGKKLMTPFNEILSPEEIKAVAVYTQNIGK